MAHDDNAGQINKWREYDLALQSVIRLIKLVNRSDWRCDDKTLAIDVLLTYIESDIESLSPEYVPF